MKRLLIVLILISALLIGAFSPNLAARVSAATAGSHAAAVHTQSHAAAFDKTKFVLHLAVAAFLIHYIYKKYTQHKLGRTHIFTDIKAAAAGLVAYHELKVAYDTAKKSNSATLHALIAPISGPVAECRLYEGIALVLRRITAGSGGRTVRAVEPRLGVCAAALS